MVKIYFSRCKNIAKIEHKKRIFPKVLGKIPIMKECFLFSQMC